ncbi:MAG: hypothetical protein Q3983_09600 [Capnocytophaga sp.]|nr:hypothetical protein [Capnocytophaga sp.]
MSDERFVERSMYGGPGDKKPITPLIWSIVIALLILGYGIYQYLELLKFEEVGGTIKLNRIISLIYEMGGAISVLITTIILAVIMFFSGYSSYKNKKGE